MRKRSNIIRQKIADLQVERILNMTDDEILVDAIREYGSPANAEKVAERTRQAIKNAIENWGIPKAGLKIKTDEGL
jgi:hypothetical protein